MGSDRHFGSNAADVPVKHHDVHCVPEICAQCWQFVVLCYCIIQIEYNNIQG